ncbi:MobF family relaxase [Mycobacterium kiyosense]|uniref:MobF family relaxase n=1 Tax=Mycobacterium kiyosense TaxID=2871094 RepID=UPI002232B912|nr:MobF family relaxase [Mycobacterium kiyosense]
MLTISPPMKRYSVRYYNDTAQAALLAAGRARAGGGLAEYYSEGETRAPVWLCVGDTEKAASLVGLSAADRAGGPADMDAVARWLDDGTAPNGARGRAFNARSTHGFDLTFCAPKSVSMWRALATDDVTNKALLDAHNVAVREAMEYLHTHAGYTRVHNPQTGRKDLQRLPGLVAVAYQHETSRAGDPHLHTHVLLPNTQPRADGTLVSIDSKSLHHEAKAAGIIYQITLRSETHQSLGLEWGPIDPHTGMAEIAGVDRDQLAAGSQRATQLRQWAEHNLVLNEAAEGSAAQLAAAQRATRPAKPEHKPWAELRQEWATRFGAFRIEEQAQVQARRQRQTQPINVLTAARTAAAGIDKPAFTRADLIETIGARMPVVVKGAPVGPRGLLEAMAERLAVRINQPRQAHEREGHDRFTVAPVLAEEAAIVELMGARDPRGVLAPDVVDTADLSPDQARAITAIASSPWLIQPLSAPAGAGKTTSLKALRAAAYRGGKTRVLVAAPTGKAVDVAVREGAGDTGYTVAKALKDLRTGVLRLDHRTLVVVDEAGMVGTPDLRELLTAATAAGTKTVLVGDAHQLAPVKARAGMFNQLVEDLPWAQRLSEVWRMREGAERVASLAIRNAGPKPLRRAIEWYRTQGRLHAGDGLTMAHDALTGYQADLGAGKDAVLMTDSWEVCDALNTRLHRHTVAADAPTLTGARGHRIGVGDVIISRRNDTTVFVVDATITTEAEPVRNGHRWRVYKVDTANNRIAARRLTDGARAEFTGDYLTEHVHYGYAVTVHASQGVTADTAHAVLSDRATRALAYVALTRGRNHNHLYLYEKNAGEADHEHAAALAENGVHVAQRGTSRAAAALLRQVLAHDERARTVLDVAADTDRAHQPAQVRALRDHHERTRARLRADYRAHTTPATTYDLAAELPTLRAEIDFLQAASTASPAALYYPPETAVADLDDTHRRVVTAITANIHTVQALHLHPGADKHGALAALVATAHDQNHRVLALTASPAARDYAAQHHYADASGHIDSARTTLGNRPLKLPLGSLIVVDDADHLSAHNLCWLTNAAATTNTKLILITTTGDHHEPAHTLLTALQQNCLTFHELGTPDSHRKPQPRTAIERAEHHLATTATRHATHNQATELLHNQAVELLHQRTQLMHRLRDIADAAAHIDNLATPDRHIDRGYGLDIGM